MRKRPSFWQQIMVQAALLLAGLFVLFPVWNLVRIALDGSIKSVPTEFSVFPKEFTLGFFQKVWHTPAQSLDFTGLLGNSLLVAGGAAIGSIILGATMAYAFARFRFSGRKTGLFGLLIGALLPPVALMTPLFILLGALGIRSSLLGLILTYTAFSLPFCIWNMRSAFQAVEKELEEAAFLDGATHLQTFWKVTLPLALPSIAVAALVAFLAGYSEFAIGWLFAESSQNVTLAMALWGLRAMGSSPWPEISAMAILMSLPVVLIFLLLQRYLLDRLMIGGMGD